MKADYGEPWRHDSTYYVDRITRSDGSVVAKDCDWDEKTELDARDCKRIVACVNACAGIPTERLGIVKHAEELLQACKLADSRSCGCYSSETENWYGKDCHRPRVRNAIAAAEQDLKGEK